MSLSDFAGSTVVLYAYPAAMTPGCTTPRRATSGLVVCLQAAGIQVIGISPDSPAKLAKFREKDGLTFPLVSDPDKAVLTEYGAFGEKKMYGKTVTGVIRSTFVVNPDGTIDKAMYNVRARAMSPNCAASWVSDGTATIGPTRVWRNWQTRRI